MQQGVKESRNISTHQVGQHTTPSLYSCSCPPRPAPPARPLAGWLAGCLLPPFRFCWTVHVELRTYNLYIHVV
jgi:hypothetical protein